MSVLPAVTPADLELPSREEIEAVQSALTPDGAQLFTQELMEALWLSKEQEDLRPVQELVAAWYGTLLLVKKHHEPRKLRALLSARRKEKPMTYAAVKAKLGI